MSDADAASRNQQTPPSQLRLSIRWSTPPSRPRRPAGMASQRPGRAISNPVRHTLRTGQ